MRDLHDQSALITGASRGIGRALALRLGRSGMRLALCGRDSTALRSTAQEALAAGASAVLERAFDLRSEAAIKDFCAEAKAQLGVLDVLVNNAGFNSGKAAVLDVATEDWDAMMAVNLRAPFIFSREVGRDMVARGGGHIVNVLSTVCHFACETTSAYTASKRGFQGFSEVLLKELRPHGVRVSAVYPGGTNTTFRALERPDYLAPESVAECIWAVIAMPEDLVVQSVTFRPMVETNF